MIKDRNNIPKLLENLKKAGKESVQVGVFNPDVATYAAANEFGVPSKNIPERSFIRMTLDKKEVQEKCRNALEPLFDVNENPMQALDKVAVILTAEVKRTMTTAEYKPNAPETIKRKGPGKNPLYDTGTLQKSIMAKVV